MSAVEQIESAEKKSEKLAAVPPSPIKRIQKIVGDFYNVTVDEISCDRRTKRLIEPRHLSMFLSRKLTVFSLPRIGRAFGNRDHSTVIHAVRSITARCGANESFAAHVNEIERLCSLQIEVDADVIRANRDEIRKIELGTQKRAIRVAISMLDGTGAAPKDSTTRTSYSNALKALLNDVASVEQALYRALLNEAL